jgi:purine-binding chemotaxis protein CheW
LRREFDDSFAAPAATPNDDVGKLLAIVVAGHSYALDLSDLRGLLADRTIVPLPTSVPSFLGVIGDRRKLVPVFDLAALLGYPLSKETRWIALTGTAELPIGLAFERFEAQLQVDRAAAASSVVVSDGEVRPVVDVAALLSALPRANTPLRRER